MKFYDYPGFANPARISIALAEKGAADKVETITVDVMGKEHRTQDYLAKNPDASVPCLELDDGTFLSHCTAITEYIDGHFEGISLCGRTPKERAVIHMMNRRAEVGLLDAVATYFHHATDGLGPELEVYQNKNWGMKQRENALSAMEYLDGVLAKADYIAGDNFSMADITVFAGLAFADFAEVEIADNLKNLIAWRAKVAARPSIAA